jgi:uncharacterized membrane protein YbhN (UPF0104 family)
MGRGSLTDRGGGDEVADEPVETDSLPETRPNRRWWVFALRLALSAAMVWYLVRKLADVSFGELFPRPTASSVAWVAVALVLTLGSIVLAAARWRQVLHAMDLASPRFGRLISHYFAGQFVSNVLPTTIGGDVLRATRLAGDTGDGPDAFASLVIERLTGWLVLPLLTFLGLALSPAARSLGHATTIAVLLCTGTVAGLLVILFVADHPRLGGRFAAREGWRRFLGSVHLGVSRIRHRPRAAFGVVAVGLAYQLVLVLAATAAARALDIDQASVGVMLALFPAVLISQVLPIGISGLGVREGALVFFLTPLGVPADQAVALGLTVFFLNLVVSLLGAPPFVTGARRSPGRPGPAGSAAAGSDATGELGPARRSVAGSP